MIRKVDIKKQLTEEEFKELITVCEREFEQVENITKIALGCEEKTKEITPANEAFILLPDLENNEFKIVTLDRKIPMHLDKEGVISECYHTKQPLIVNDITQSFLYKEKYDNFLECEIKDLLVVPILDDSAQKNILALLWATITQGSWTQYTQKDIDYMAKFSIFIKRFLQEKALVSKHDDVPDVGSSDCLEAYDNLNAKIRKEQEYFSSIIHDIRTPMNGVLGFLELLQLNETDLKKKEYIETAMKSGESMVALISDALDISKMSSGKMSIEKIEFSILEELSDVAKLFYNSAKKKEITLNTFYDPDLPKMIYTDYHRIKQIMNNLLNNAIKFTPNKGMIALELLYDKERDGLTVSVQDSGIGVAKERQKDIFTPYTQEKSSTSREYGGTGLGLSISQQLSVLLGGKMELESEEGKGSKFYFTIPCNTDKETAPSIEKEKLKGLSVMFYDSKNGSITIDTAKRYMESFNLTVKGTEEGESLKSIRNDTFDILMILKEDTVSQEEEIQEILDTGKSVILLDEGYLDEYNWFVGKLEIVNSPLLPDDLYSTILKFTSPSDNFEKEISISDNFEKVKDKRILVVDDSEINLKFMKEILKLMHIETILAQSGEESLEKFESEKFDLIFMDENMPGMQGVEAITLMRKSEEEKEDSAVIIGLTGDIDKKTKNNLLDAGANEVATKPIQVKEITNIIAKFL